MELFSEIPVEVLEQDRSVIFGLDSCLRIVYCNAAWDVFAAANGGSGLLRPAPIGQVLLDSIGAPLDEYYESVYERVLQTSEPWRHIYECSSASTFRKFAMQVLPMKRTHGLLVVNSLCVERPHDPSRSLLPESEYQSANGMVVMCGHCRRTRRSHGPEQWDWVPEHVEHMPRNTSHGLCDVCLEYYYPRQAFSGPDEARRSHR